MVISETDGSLRNRDVQDRRLSLIDVSSADDSLIDPVSGNPVHHQRSENQEHAYLLYTPDSKKFEDASSKLEEWERGPQPNETFEIGKPKRNSKCNLRKSLAWDSAFFTSAGVLDPEELSSIIEGAEKDEKHALPGIQEDMYQSCESISTLESDSLTLESLEADLFEDIRASIQKSSNTSNLASGNSRVSSGVPGLQTGETSKMVGVTSCNQAPPPSKNPRAGMQGLEKMTKKNPIFPQLPQKPVATRRESSILKQSKLPGKSSPSSAISAKRASLGDLHVNSGRDKEKSIIGGRVSSVSKASGIGGSRGILPKPTPSSKSPSGPSVSTKTKSATSTSSASNLSGHIGKSPFNSLKRKVDAGTIKPPSSSSAVRTPSRIASRNKTESENSSLSGLMSVTKLSSSISPASSISDCSSESSSSTAMAKHRSNSSRTSLDSSSSRKFLSDTDAHQGTNSQNHQNDSSLEGQETQHTGFISQCSRTAPAGTVLPPAPMKPSGLRLPSPKIGFFDGVKSSVRTPRGGMQPHSVPRGLPKHGAGSPIEGQNKAKLGKLQPARCVMSIENTKANNQQNSHPTPLHESLGVAVKTSSTFKNVKSSSEILMEVQNEAHLETGAGNVKSINTVDEGHIIGIHDLDLGSTQNNGTHDISIDEINSEIRGRMRSVDIKAPSTDEELNNSDSSSTYVGNSYSSEVVGECKIHCQFDLPKAEGPAVVSRDIDMHICDTNGAILTDGDHNACVSSAIENVEKTSPSHVVEKAPVFRQLDLINDLHPLKGVNNQESSHYDDQVDCLSRHVGLMDINFETQKKFNDDSLSSSHPDISFQDKSSGLELSSHKQLLDCPKKEEELKDSSAPCLSLSPTCYNMAAPIRRPFAVKDSLCNMDGLLSVFTESTVAEVKQINLPVPESIMKENI